MDSQPGQGSIPPGSAFSQNYTCCIVKLHLLCLCSEKQFSNFLFLNMLSTSFWVIYCMTPCCATHRVVLYSNCKQN